MPTHHGEDYEFYPGAPKYFKYIYDTTGIPPVQHPRPDWSVLTPQFRQLAIYGFSVKSPFPEDDHIEARAFKNGYFMGYCFSTVEPEGEYGSTPLADVTEITEQEFEEARKRGWVER